MPMNTDAQARPRMRWGYRIPRFLCQWGATLYFRTRVFGLHHVPARGGVLLVCNHQSFMDPVLLTMALHREADFMARDTLFAHPWFRRLITYLNAFPVKRGAADVGAIKEALRRLRQGRLIVLFPEGTRTPDGRIGPFLPGLGAIARKAAVPLVPTLLDGMSRSWPRHARFPRPGHVIVEYGRPLMPAEYAGWSVEQLMDELRGRLLRMQHRWHSRVPDRRLEWWEGGGEPGPWAREP